MAPKKTPIMRQWLQKVAVTREFSKAKLSTVKREYTRVSVIMSSGTTVLLLCCAGNWDSLLMVRQWCGCMHRISDALLWHACYNESKRHNLDDILNFNDTRFLMCRLFCLKLETDSKLSTLQLTQMCLCVLFSCVAIGAVTAEYVVGPNLDSDLFFLPLSLICSGEEETLSACMVEMHASSESSCPDSIPAAVVCQGMKACMHTPTHCNIAHMCAQYP